MTDTTRIAIVPAQETVEGGGFRIRRPFPVPALSYFDPFLLIDEMGPVQYGPGEALGAPDHPHRGFETVSYIIAGAMEHEDSFGHRGRIGPGDVQWMTAGAGVIHSEMPAKEILANGGTMHGFQIWVNLPQALKLAQPRYQEYSHAQLPLITEAGRWIRVIAGAVEGQRSPIETTVPTTLLHVRLDAGITTSLPVPRGANAIVHAMTGSAQLLGETVHAHQAALIAQTPDALVVTAGETGIDALVLAGMPLNEPVARYGPFVMNTREEIMQAFSDYQEGRFGAIARLN
jgi:hypothetical protein